MPCLLFLWNLMWSDYLQIALERFLSIRNQWSMLLMNSMLQWHRSLGYWQLALYFGKKLSATYTSIWVYVSKIGQNLRHSRSVAAGTRLLWAERSNMVSKLKDTSFGTKYLVLTMLNVHCTTWCGNLPKFSSYFAHRVLCHSKIVQCNQLKCRQ